MPWRSDYQPAGGGTARFKTRGRLHIDTTAVGTDADLLEKDLMSYNIPANTLAKDGDALVIRFTVSTAANANTKRFRVYFGSLTVYDSGATVYNNKTQIFLINIFRTGVGAQIYDAHYQIKDTGTPATNFSSATEDETAAITIKVSGENGVATADDAVARILTVDYVPAP